MSTAEQNGTATHSEPFSKEQNDEVYNRLVAGGEKARVEMIEGNMALVVFRVDAYLRSAPQMAYYRDDMISEGFVGLCEAVDRMLRVGRIKNPRPTGCITRAIDRSINHLVDRANTIVVPDRVQRRARAKGKPMQPPRTVAETALNGAPDATFCDHDAAKELHEEILASCCNDIEKQIVRMRSEGHTNASIGLALGLSDTTISSRRKAIYRRLLKRCPEYRETQRALAKKAARKAAREARKKAKCDPEHPA